MYCLNTLFIEGMLDEAQLAGWVLANAPWRELYGSGVCFASQYCKAQQYNKHTDQQGKCMFVSRLVSGLRLPLSLLWSSQLQFPPLLSLRLTSWDVSSALLSWRNGEHVAEIVSTSTASVNAQMAFGQDHDHAQESIFRLLENLLCSRRARQLQWLVPSTTVSNWRWVSTLPQVQPLWRGAIMQPLWRGAEI